MAADDRPDSGILHEWTKMIPIRFAARTQTARHNTLPCLKVTRRTKAQDAANATRRSWQSTAADFFIISRFASIDA